MRLSSVTRLGLLAPVSLVALTLFCLTELTLGDNTKEVYRQEVSEAVKKDQQADSSVSHQSSVASVDEADPSGNVSIMSASFTPPSGWSFASFDSGGGGYVDIIPASIDGLPANASPNSSSQIRIFWFAASRPKSSDWFQLRAEGNLSPPGGGGEGGTAKKWAWGASINTPAVRIIPSRIDQDDPAATTWTYITGNPLVAYGGSAPITADNLRLYAAIEDFADCTAKSYKWSVSGPGSQDYTPPAASLSADTWDVGDLQPTAGTLKFICEVEFLEGNSVSAIIEIEVGIRTDDTIVIGWIDPAGVPLSITGVDQDVLDFFPTNGVFPSETQRLLTLNYMLNDLYAASDPANIHRPGVPIQIGYLSFWDRDYILDWMFKYAANPTAPPPSFPNENSITAYVNGTTDYKLFNRLQVRYQVDANGSTFNGDPYVVQHTARIGQTIDPVLNVIVNGQTGPLNGTLSTASDSIRSYNEGSPPQQAVTTFNHLVHTYSIPPRYWSMIGNRILFTLANGTTPDVANQVYPTYYIYQNGAHTVTRPQASSPYGNFYLTPYPGGSAPWIP